MRVFILNSGRCGSTSFIRACSHIRNYSSAHESRIHLIGTGRLDYPDNHIEADNRLSWLLGRLDLGFGAQAFYVHLQRNAAATAASFARRREFGIMQAYRQGVLLGGLVDQTDLEVAADYLQTIDANIRLFLRDKPYRMDFQLEQAQQDFPRFWQAIGAEGDMQAALAEWSIRHNASG